MDKNQKSCLTRLILKIVAGTLQLVQIFKPTRKLVHYFFLPGHKLI